MPERARTLSNPESERQRRLDYNRARYAYDEIEKLYRTRAWYRFRDFIRARNPQCQRIVNGVRCLHPATELHHLVSPRVDVTLFLVVSNVVMLCARHHPGGQAGTPHWREGVDYTPTVSTINEF
jgi:hypothetical protein